MDAKRKLDETYVNRITDAILTCDNTIDAYLASYAGCKDLAGLVELWEDYWNDLILK